MPQPDAPTLTPQQAAQLPIRVKQLLADVMAEIQRGKNEAKRMDFGIEIPKDRANQFLLRYSRIQRAGG